MALCCRFEINRIRFCRLKTDVGNIFVTELIPSPPIKGVFEDCCFVTVSGIVRNNKTTKFAIMCILTLPELSLQKKTIFEELHLLKYNFVGRHLRHVLIETFVSMKIIKYLNSMEKPSKFAKSSLNFYPHLRTFITL